jgi:hypothetical protein
MDQMHIEKLERPVLDFSDLEIPNEDRKGFKLNGKDGQDLENEGRNEWSEPKSEEQQNSRR